MKYTMNKLHKVMKCISNNEVLFTLLELEIRLLRIAQNCNDAYR